MRIAISTMEDGPGRGKQQQGTVEEGDTTCDCGVSSENTRHIFEYPLFAHSCALDDHLQFNETAKHFVEPWKTAVFDDTMKKKYQIVLNSTF